MKTIKSDVVIIGSGFGAAAPALRLSRAGLRVTVLEKGPLLKGPADFKQTQDPRYLLKYLKGLSGENINFTYAEALGGGSGFYEMVSLRAPTLAFEQTDGSGRPIWPTGVDRAALDPHYELAEEMLRVRQLDHERIPKTGLVFSLMMKRLGYSCERCRYAVVGCVGSGYCVTGCIYGAKQTLHMNYLPQAVEAGASVLTGIEALAVRPVRNPRRARHGAGVSSLPYRYEVACRRADGSSARFRTRLLILAAGTVGTAGLLLRSRRYLRALSDQVGRNIAFNGSVKVAGLLPEDLPEGDMYSGITHPGMISYEFLRSHGITVAAVKALPLMAVAAARLRLDGDGRSPSHWGTPNVELMKSFRRRAIALLALGLTPPTAVIELHDGKIRPRLELTEEIRAYYRRTKELLHSILTRNGCRLIETESIDGKGAAREDLFFSTAHQVGSCRMADSPELGVVDSDGRAFGYPGLYVSDGAAVPGSLAVNTSLTILANAERIAAGLVARYRP
ncbi:MAG: GMC family oxidoreductase [Gemmatimonadota bacterium]